MSPTTAILSKCPRCGKALAHDAPEGLCVPCLARINLVSDSFLTGAEASSYEALSPAEIAPFFPQFEVLECLGRGGMGVVYKARQKSLDRLVALKILAPEREKDPQFAERFAREALALAKLNHPHIVTVYDFGQANGLYYLLMEYVDGMNLRELLLKCPLEPQAALAVVPPICEALQYAHDHGIVHRDIKPENLLLDKTGQIKIADFGVAQILGDNNQKDKGQRVGTPAYMAPEQFAAVQSSDHRADIYSLGVVLYEMLTGELPKLPLELPARKLKIDVQLDEIVLRAMDQQPALRFQKASELKTAIETVTENVPAQKHDPLQANTGFHWKIDGRSPSVQQLLLAMIVVLLAMLVGILLLGIGLKPHVDQVNEMLAGEKKLEKFSSGELSNWNEQRETEFEENSHKKVVDRLALPLVQSNKGVAGLMVGILSPAGERRFFGYGHVKAGGEVPTSKTTFEIGGVTALFTTLALARMVEANVAKLDDQASRYLPAKFELPRRGQREITLLELATHSSGLPRNPPNLTQDRSAWWLSPKFPLNVKLDDPWGQYDDERLQQGLKRIKLTPLAQPKRHYSNLGLGLLGNCLAHNAGMSFEELVKTWITAPLEMNDTVLSTATRQPKSIAVGHIDKTTRATYWTAGALPGCGAFLSTADDLMKILAVECGHAESELANAMKMTQASRFTTSRSSGTALGLHYFDKKDGQRVFWLNGATRGFSSFIAFSREPKAAVVVLCNTGVSHLDDDRIDLLGTKILLSLSKEQTKLLYEHGGDQNDGQK